MANKNNAAKAAKEMAADAKKSTQQPKDNKKDQKVQVVQLGDLDKLAQQKALAQLDPNHQVDLMTGLRKMLHEDPNAAVKYDISQEAVDKINKLVMLGHVTIFANTVLTETTPFAITMRASQLEAIKEVAPMLGIIIDTTKALPAPGKEGVVSLPSTAIEISKEAAQKAVEEAKAATKEQEKGFQTAKEKDIDYLNIIDSMKDESLVAFINSSFSKNFKKDSKVVRLATETYDEELKQKQPYRTRDIQIHT